MTDLFVTKNIQPMLLTEREDPFDDPAFIYELKLDGIRAIAYLEKGGVELRNKRNLRINATYPELRDINRQVNAACILDGEIVVMRNGVPDFAEVQRRSLMSNTMKIELTASRLPVSFVAYDILQIEDRPLTDLPLIERKELLQNSVQESPRLALSHWFQGQGVELFKLTVERGLEGIVAKRRDSKYWEGKRSKDWIKIKNLQDEDFIICGYELKEGSSLASIILATKDAEGKLTYRSHVSVGVFQEDFQIIRSQKKTTPHFPEKGGDVVWIEPVLLCTVVYMQETVGGGLRQPVFKGLKEGHG